MGKIDTSGWKEFRVGELFEKLNLRFLSNRVFDKASDISEVKSEEFNLPLVNAKHSNNGIMYYGRKHEWEYEVLTIDIVADGGKLAHCFIKSCGCLCSAARNWSAL